MRRTVSELVLRLGGLVALANLVGWTLYDRAQYGEWTRYGLDQATFILGAVLIMYGIARFAERYIVPEA